MAQCDECGGQINRFKANGGHANGCPVASGATQRPAVGRDRQKRYHEAEWGDSPWKTNKNALEQILGTVWNCAVCGKKGQSPNASAPGATMHEGAKP